MWSARTARPCPACSGRCPRRPPPATRGAPLLQPTASTGWPRLDRRTPSCISAAGPLCAVDPGQATAAAPCAWADGQLRWRDGDGRRHRAADCAPLIAAASRVVGFTGAGISTESGVRLPQPGRGLGAQPDRLLRGIPVERGGPRRVLAAEGRTRARRERALAKHGRGSSASCRTARAGKLRR